MVYPDITTEIKNQKNKLEATVLQRMFAVVLDYFILSPVISFFCVILFSKGLNLYQQFPNSQESEIILLQIGIGFIFLFTLVQALFISLAGGTPGQIFTKTFIHFENKTAHIFFQSWLRQWGFVGSVLLLGIPFLAVIYHPRRQTIYERMTESGVYTYVTKPFEILNWGASERRYVSVFISTFLFFSIFLSVLSFQHFYQKTLSSNLTFEKIKAKQHFCSELDSVKQESRLSVATALNLVGLLPDRCLDLEADFVLWRNFSNEVGLDLKSQAYFAKYLTATDDDTEAKYLGQACQQDTKSEFCEFAKSFEAGDFLDLLAKLKSKDSNLLNDTLKYEIASILKQDIKQPLKDLEKYATFKLVNKYLIRERLDQLQYSSTRSPASMNYKDELIQDIQKRIDEL